MSSESRKPYGYWTKQNLAAAIKKMSESGEPLTSHNVQSTHADIFKAAMKIFKTWNRALEALGYDLEKVGVKKIFHNDEELKQKILSLDRKNFDLSATNMRLNQDAKIRHLYYRVLYRINITWEAYLLSIGVTYACTGRHRDDYINKKVYIFSSQSELPLALKEIKISLLQQGYKVMSIQSPEVTNFRKIKSAMKYKNYFPEMILINSEYVQEDKQALDSLINLSATELKELFHNIKFRKFYFRSNDKLPKSLLLLNSLRSRIIQQRKTLIVWFSDLEDYRLNELVLDLGADWIWPQLHKTSDNQAESNFLQVTKIWRQKLNKTTRGFDPKTNVLP